MINNENNEMKGNVMNNVVVRLRSLKQIQLGY